MKDAHPELGESKFPEYFITRLTYRCNCLTLFAALANTTEAPLIEI